MISVIRCMKCGKCRTVCNQGAITHIDGVPMIDHDKCDLCLRCVMLCPNKALVNLD